MNKISSAIDGEEVLISGSNIVNVFNPATGKENIALGDSRFTGENLASRPDVNKVSFTESTAIGKHIQRIAADEMKSVNLELGGKNAIIVFEDEDLDKAPNSAIINAFANAGQLCVSCFILVVHETIASEFQSILLKGLSKLKVGDPDDEDTQVGAMITKAQNETALNYIKIDIDEGCNILTGCQKSLHKFN